jgi:hypothetical protein
MRVTFEIGNPADTGSAWEEEVEPTPVPGDIITHDQHRYVVQPIPIYTQQRSSTELAGTFKVIKVDDEERNP